MKITIRVKDQSCNIKKDTPGVSGITKRLSFIPQTNTIVVQEAQDINDYLFESHSGTLNIDIIDETVLNKGAAEVLRKTIKQGARGRAVAASVVIVSDDRSPAAASGKAKRNKFSPAVPGSLSRGVLLPSPDSAVGDSSPASFSPERPDNIIIKYFSELGRYCLVFGDQVHELGERDDLAGIVFRASLLIRETVDQNGILKSRLNVIGYDKEDGFEICVASLLNDMIQHHSFLENSVVTIEEGARDDLDAKNSEIVIKIKKNTKGFHELEFLIASKVDEGIYNNIILYKSYQIGNYDESGKKISGVLDFVRVVPKYISDKVEGLAHATKATIYFDELVKEDHMSLAFGECVKLLLESLNVEIDFIGVSKNRDGAAQGGAGAESNKASLAPVSIGVSLLAPGDAEPAATKIVLHVDKEDKGDQSGEDLDPFSDYDDDDKTEFTSVEEELVVASAAIEASSLPGERPSSAPGVSTLGLGIPLSERGGAVVGK